ncbi:hypothetical protein [Actinoplanes sp. NPDC020271]|uniref:hypothetical protein n=1 Tax=Actinoplanes sp. NPDC020271 TaxID=3363896 RepID=UPI00379F90CA
MTDDLDLLNEYGPGATEVPAAVLNAAGTALAAEIAAATTPVRRNTRRRLLVAAMAAAAVAAVGVAVVVRPGESRPVATRTSYPVRLVAATAPEFGYEIPGLGDPVFTAGPGGPIIAVYQVGSPEKSVSLMAGPSDVGGTPGRRPVEVNGHPGQILFQPDGMPGGLGSGQLSWEYAPGVWLTVGTNGRRATEAEIVALAASVREKRQPLDFEATLGLIPEGWTLAGFKQSFLLTYADPAAPDQQVHLQWWPTPPSGDGGELAGLEKSTPVTINGRAATLSRAAEIWAVEGGRLPDGSAFRLTAPRTFPAEQILAMARSVRRTG